MPDRWCLLVTAPMFLVPPEAAADLAEGSLLLLDGPEGRHAATVRRLAAGEPVLLGDGRGTVARGVVETPGRDQLLVRLGEVVHQAAPTTRFVLVQALAKGDRDDRAVEAATELGVDEIVAWQAERSVVVWRADRAGRSLGKWQDTVRAAAKQARRAWHPVVTGPAALPDLLSRTKRASLVVVLHEEASQPLSGVPLPDQGEVVLVVGPEGGISPRELSALTGAGALAARLGPLVLRSSTAGPAALAVLSAQHRWR